MAGSAADTPAASTGPQFIRVSDADRDRAIEELKQEFTDGRLSHETFMLRMHSALGARHRADLAGLFTDLPKRQRGLARLRAAVRNWRRRVEEMLGEPARYPGVTEEPAPAPAIPHPAQASAAPLYFPRGTDTSFTIGRDQRCDLFIADLTVSRLHARLTRDESGWLLTDLGSTNGTRVNGWRVREPVPVRGGDLVRFGSASFVVLEPLAGEPDGGAPSG